MVLIPDDSVFYFSVGNEKFYFSSNYILKEMRISIVEIMEDEFWCIVKGGNLQKHEVSPAIFPYPVLPASITGNVTVFPI